MKLNLTEKKVLEKKFKKSVKGYDPVDVDEFFDLVLNDYRNVDQEINSLNNYILELKRENESIKSKLRSKESEMLVLKAKYEKITSDTNEKTDNLELLQKCSAYEKKLFQLGVDPSKVK